MQDSLARDEALTNASALYRSGSISAARLALVGARSAAALLEAARFALQAGDYAEAHAHSRAAASASDATPATVALAAAMSASALALQGEPTGSQLVTKADISESDPLYGETLYYHAVTAFCRHELHVADSILLSHVPQDPSLRARFLTLRGLVAGASEQYEAQARLTAGAIDILRREKIPDVTLLASAAEVLSLLVRELPSMSIDALAALEQELPWTDDLATSRFHILRSLAWACALKCDFFSAIKLLRKSQVLARTRTLRLYSHIDLATVALYARNELTARTEFELADELAREIDWSAVRDNSLIALPFLATLAADIEPERARYYCELALENYANMSPRWAHAHGRRQRALIGEAIALAYADVDEQRSAREAEATLETLARSGHLWRAGRMAIHLYFVTRNVEWRDRAEQYLASYAESPFARLLNAISMERYTLSMRQRQVLNLIVAGKDNREIAALLGITVNTVRNHLQRVLFSYGISRRSDLQRVYASA